MRRIKALLDPDGLLNPGVIINDDPKAHLAISSPCRRAMPSWIRASSAAFAGGLPSRTLSLSPRQRIVLYREVVAPWSQR